MDKKKFYENTKSYKTDYVPNENTIDHLKTLEKLAEQNGRVLDVGCGNGMTTEFIGKTKKNEFHGIDIGTFNVKAAKHKGMKAVVWDVEKKWPYKDNYFDGVIASGIIEHLFDHHFFLEEIKRVLKPGGYVVIMTNNVAYWVNRLLLAAGKTPVDMQPHKAMEENQHIRYFTKKTLGELFEIHGFKMEKTFTRYPQIPYLVRFSRRLGNPYINAGGLGFMIYLKARKEKAAL